MTDTDAALAALHFSKHQEPDLRNCGMPDDGIAHLRDRYIRDAIASPEAVRQLRRMYGPNAATSCDQCGNTNAADLRWSGDSLALCRYLPACQVRATTRRNGATS